MGMMFDFEGEVREDYSQDTLDRILQNQGRILQNQEKLMRGLDMPYSRMVKHETEVQAVLNRMRANGHR